MFHFNWILAAYLWHIPIMTDYVGFFIHEISFVSKASNCKQILFGGKISALTEYQYLYFSWVFCTFPNYYAPITVWCPMIISVQHHFTDLKISIIPPSLYAWWQILWPKHVGLLMYILKLEPSNFIYWNLHRKPRDTIGIFCGYAIRTCGRPGGRWLPSGCLPERIA